MKNSEKIIENLSINYDLLINYPKKKKKNLIKVNFEIKINSWPENLCFNHPEGETIYGEKKTKC